jgi:hypothetical protein
MRLNFESWIPALGKPLNRGLNICQALKYEILPFPEVVSFCLYLKICWMMIIHRQNQSLLTVI